MKDLMSVIAGYLAASGTGLYSLCGARIYDGGLPKGFQNTAAAIVLTEINIGSHASRADHLVTIQARCYGGSALRGSAKSVYRALFDRLHGAYWNGTPGTIIRADQVSAQDIGPDPETGWPVYNAIFDVRVEEG